MEKTPITPEINHRFTSNQRLIAVDGPDGSGKSTITRELKKILTEKVGKEKVVVIQPGKFDETPESMQLQSKLPQRVGNPFRTNSVYLAAVSKGFYKARRALNEGKYVILDSGIIRAAEHDSALNGEKAKGSFRRWLISGRLTHFLLPGIQINIKTSEQEALENIRSRGDEETPSKIVAIYAAYEDAERNYESIPSQRSSIKKLNIDNKRQMNSNPQKYIAKLIEEQILPVLTIHTT